MPENMYEILVIRQQTFPYIIAYHDLIKNKLLRISNKLKNLKKFK